MIRNQQEEYKLIDSGHGLKLERWGPYLLARPASQAVWPPQPSEEKWSGANAIFSREEEDQWHVQVPIPSKWTITLEDLRFKVSLTDFGHLGLFPEHAKFWSWMKRVIEKREKPIKVLNLFAYTGGATLAAAKAGAEVCHLDASKTAVQWARENAKLNGLEKAPIRWIVDDVHKFLKREVRRGSLYDAILLDPPSFGRGPKGELFKIERDLVDILLHCEKLFSTDPLFFLLTCHTPGWTPIGLRNLSCSVWNRKGKLDSGELFIQGPLQLPSGTYVRWQKDDELPTID